MVFSDSADIHWDLGISGRLKSGLLVLKRVPLCCTQTCLSETDSVRSEGSGHVERLAIAIWVLHSTPADCEEFRRIIDALESYWLAVYGFPTDKIFALPKLGFA
jgi:hypothetical protein